MSFIQSEKAQCSISVLCRVVGLSRSQYYEALKQRRSARAMADVELSRHIKEVFDLGRGNYGSPRVHDELSKRGFNVSRKRVIRLMQEAGLTGSHEAKI